MQPKGYTVEHWRLYAGIAPMHKLASMPCGHKLALTVGRQEALHVCVNMHDIYGKEDPLDLHMERALMHAWGRPYWPASSSKPSRHR